MKKLFFLTLLFLVPCVAFSQNDEGENIVVGEELSFMAPNYENIKRDISDPSSRFYYPRLLERLAKCDTTLDLEELRCIYYGYVHQPDFEPYGHFDEQQEIRGILFGDSEPSHSDFVKVRDLAEKVIAKKPTELPMYYYRLIGSYYTYGDSDPRTAAARRTLSMLLDAVYSTGDGSYHAPIHLTTVAHSYFIMSMNDMQPEGQALINIGGRFCDEFPLAFNESGVDTLYFDIHECFMSMSRMFESHDEASTTRAGSQLELPLGTHFIIKMEGALDDEDTKFKVVEMEPYDKVLPNYHDTGLFADAGEANTIEGYFVRAKFGSGEKIVLIFKSWIEGMAAFDTDIRSERGQAWEETSNSGMFYKAEMTEIWDTSYDMLRISNIRKAK